MCADRVETKHQSRTSRIVALYIFFKGSDAFVDFPEVNLHFATVTRENPKISHAYLRATARAADPGCFLAKATRGNGFTHMGPNLAAVRGFRRRYTPRPDFETLLRQAL